MSSPKSASKLFTPLQVGRYQLDHRVVLAPLTRVRSAEPTLAPTEIHQQYYSQRATKGGLLISEATFISPETVGVHHAPGIWTDEQVEGWSKVTQAVKDKGGYIFSQLWHIGAVAHTDYREHPLVKDSKIQPCVSASAVQLAGTTATPEGQKPFSVPRALETEEISRLLDDYRHAAECAKKAGFHGVELHAAHGYLIDQFLNDKHNTRNDQYGGSVENRCRLLSEALDVLIDVWGADRVGVRLSPHQNNKFSLHGVSDSDPHSVYSHAVKVVNEKKIAYLFFTEPRWNGQYGGDGSDDAGTLLPVVNSDLYRKLYDGVLLGASGFTPISASLALDQDKYDFIAFGRWFISNPDLVHRIQHGLPLNGYYRPTFYCGTYPKDLEVGYTDYPTFPEVQEKLGFQDADLADEETLKKITQASKDLKYPLILQSDIGVSASSAARAN